MEAESHDKQRDYEKDWAQFTTLKYLVHATKEHIVFIDTDNDLDWATTDVYEHKSPVKHNAIMNEAALLESTPCTGMAASVRLHFKRLIGEGMVRSFEHDYVSASSMLVAARSYIRARGEETSRLWYLSASFVATIPFLIAGGVVWPWRDAFSRTFGAAALWITLAAVAGAMGALLSVIARTGKLKFDCSSGRKLHYLEGTSRICAGALSGIIVGLSIISGLFLAPLAHGEKTHSIMMVAAFAAGAVERLATSIISTVGAGHVKIPTERVELSETEDGG
jgi:hypothetical protein